MKHCVQPSLVGSLLYTVLHFFTFDMLQTCILYINHKVSKGLEGLSIFWNHITWKDFSDLTLPSLKVGHWVVYSTSSEYWNFCIIVPLTSQVFPSLFSSRRVWSRIYWFPIWTVPIVLVGTWTIEYLTMICASQKSATMALWKRRNIATLESNANLDQLQKISNMAEKISQLI